MFTWIEMVALLITALIVPYVVQLIKTEAITGRKAQWIAVGLSLLAGLITAFVSGIPDTPQAWITCIMAAIGAVQFAYTVFKTVGITNKWLDALGAIGGTQNDLNVIKTQQSMADKAEERVRKEQ